VNGSSPMPAKPLRDYPLDRLDAAIELLAPRCPAAYVADSEGLSSEKLVHLMLFTAGRHSVLRELQEARGLIVNPGSDANVFR